MKLLYITNDLCIKGGVERILADCVNYFVHDLAYEIYIVTINEYKSSSYDYNEKVHIISLNHRKSNIRFFGKFYDMFTFYKSLDEVLSSIVPDIVIKVQTSGYSWVIPMVKKEIPKILWVHTSKEGLEITMKKNQNVFFNYIYWKICVFFMEKYHNVVLLTKDDVEAWGVKNGVVIGNFTNYENVNGEESTLKEKNAICIARYDYFKRLDLLIKIWEKVHSDFPDWKLNIYGGYGSEKDNISNMVDTLNLSDCVFLHDATNEIGRKLQESSVFCFTSQFEGFGLVLIEAMQFGVPVIAFSVVGVNSIVENGRNGFLVEFGNIDEYVIKLKTLLESYEMRKSIGGNAKKSLGNFSKTNIMKKWTMLFESLCSL